MSFQIQFWWTDSDKFWVLFSLEDFQDQTVQNFYYKKKKRSRKKSIVFNVGYFFVRYDDGQANKVW
jgi:hypothetical protein